MKVNYHTHTWRCNHAEPDERTYVERAIEGGFEVLGFSEHAPYVWESGFKSWFRMHPSQMDDYVDTILSLKKEYQDDIEIKLGMEVEYYPACYERLMEFLKDYPIEYRILGQHYIGSEEGEPYMGATFVKGKYLERYVEQVIEAMQTEDFLYLAHPDLPAYIGFNATYRKHMKKLCLAAKECHIPLEINLQGILLGKHYPREFFWKIAGEVGNEVLFGSDAHQPDAVVPEESIRKAEDIVKKYDLQLVDRSIWR